MGLGHVRTLLVLWLMLTSIATAQQVTRINSGQEFVDQVLQWVSHGGTLTLAMAPGNTSLAGTTWPLNSSSPTQWPQQKAALTVAGSTVVPYGQQTPIKTDISLLDFAMKSSLTPSFDDPGITLEFKNVVMVNLCSVLLSWLPDRNWFITTSSNNNIMPRSRFVLTQTRTNVTAYGSQGEIIGMIYWQIMYHMPFDDVHTFAMTKLLNKVPPVASLVAAVTKYRLLLATCHLPGGSDVWFDYRATNNATDTLRLMSLGGTLMEHRWCNTTDGTALGPLMTPAQQSMNSTIFPMWVADNDIDLRFALVDLATHATAQRDTDPYLTLLITNNVSMPSQDWTLRSDVIIVGPFNHVPGFEVHVSLDMTNASIDLTSSRLMLANLTVHGLVALPLPGTTYTTVLGFQGVRGGGSQGVRLANVKLVVPQSDFAALLSAAWRGQYWKSGARSTAELMNGISTFQPDTSTQLTRAQLVLQSYQGWGVVATNLTIVPTAPLPDTFVLPDPFTAPSDMSESSGGAALSAGAKIGIGVGVGLGAMLLMALAGLAVWRHSSCNKYHGSAADVETPDKQLPKQPDMKPWTSAPVAMIPNGGRIPHARSHIHRAVSQAQEAIAGSNRGSSNGTPTPPACSATASLNGTPANFNGTFTASGTAAAAAALAARVTVNSSREQQSSGSTNACTTGSAGRQSVDAAAGEGCTEPSMQPHATSIPGIEKMDPVKAVMAKAGTIQKSDADKLTLQSVLGRGAWGTVYKGTWRGLTVAVKTVLFSEREDGNATLPHERAIMEAAVCTSVAHRNVVATYYYDIKPVRMVTDHEDDGLVVETAASSDALHVLNITDWKLFLVQEWCNSTLGQALRSWLLHKKPTREPMMDLLLDLLIDVASGVLYLHDKNIIHGDLKPENVMLKTDSSAQIGVVAKITDFGLSTTLGPQATHVSNYKSGTPFYVAPEVTSQGRTTKASDTYSMGVLMWESYCCTPPWIKVAGEYQANGRFPIFPPDAARPFVQLARSCLAKECKQRPPFTTIVTQLKAMLDAWQAGYDNLEPPTKPMSAGPPPVGVCNTVLEAIEEPSATTDDAHMGAAAVQQEDVAGSSRVSAQRVQSAGVPGTEGISSRDEERYSAGLARAPSSSHANAALLSEWVRNSQPMAHTTSGNTGTVGSHSPNPAEASPS